MKKLLIALILVLIVMYNNVYATTISGNGDAKDYGNQGGGETCTDTAADFNLASGIRITVLRSNGSKIASADFYSSQSANKPSSSSGNNCSKIEYLKGKCQARSNSVYSAGFKSFMDSDSDKGGKNSSTAIQKIFDFLESSDYDNLKKLVSKTGYNCLGNVGSSGCSASVMNDTYIVVEPMAMFNSTFATAYEMPKWGTDCYLSNKWGRFASFTVPNGTYMGLKLSDKVTGDNFYSAIHSSTSTNGLMIYSVSDIVDIPDQDEPDAEEPQKYTLTITKFKSSDGIKKVMPGQIFYVYIKGIKHSCTTNSKGVCKIENIPSRTLYYTVREQKYSGYNISCEGCDSVEEPNKLLVTINGSDKTITVTNTSKCEYDFQQLRNKSNKAERIKLYFKYEYTNLLNFNETRSSVACSNAICDYNKDVSCLSGSAGKNESFNSSNLSCFDHLYYSGSNFDNSVYIGFCNSYFDINSNEQLLNDNFTSFSGGVLFRNLKTSSFLNAAVKRDCYLFKKNNFNPEGPGVGFIQEGNILSGIDNNTLSFEIEGDELTNNDIDVNMSEDLRRKKLEGNNYLFEKNYNFTFKGVYSKIFSGEIVTGEAPSGLYKLIGYGPYSKLNSNISSSFTFNYKFNKSTGRIENSTTCNYTITPEIIIPGDGDDDNNNDDMLNLEFRVIDTENPFPGKSGNIRNVGSNWSMNYNGNLDDIKLVNVLKLINNIKNGTTVPEEDYTGDGIVNLTDAFAILHHVNESCELTTGFDNSGNNCLIKGLMYATNNSYNKKNTEPLYEITLTPETIVEIRNDNYTNSYNNDSLTCIDDGKICISNYVTTLINKYGLEINEVELVSNSNIKKTPKRIIYEKQRNS